MGVLREEAQLHSAFLQLMAVRGESLKAAFHSCLLSTWSGAADAAYPYTSANKLHKRSLARQNEGHKGADVM